MTRRAARRRAPAVAPERLPDALPPILAHVRKVHAGERAVFYCDWCETEHLHMVGDGPRCAHCTVHDSGYTWTGYNLLMDGREGERPALRQQAVHTGRRRLRTTAATLARRIRRTVIESLLGQPLRGGRCGITLNGYRIFVSDDGLWGVSPEDGGDGKRVEVKGEGLSGLAAALYGVPRGVAAARLLQAVTGDEYDPQALAEISAAVEGWAARGAPAWGVGE